MKDHWVVPMAADAVIETSGADRRKERSTTTRDPRVGVHRAIYIVRVLEDLAEVVDAGWQLVREIPGYLTEREARFLMAAIALAPAGGANVEIGSFKGRSTAGLAYVARHYGLGPIVAIDPHTCPSPSDPVLVGQDSTFDNFVDNLARAAVTDAVVPRRAYSSEVASGWEEPIRFLWIDGDHSYAATQSDMRLFKPFLAEGALVVMHDVLGTWEGPLRVFDEDILRGGSGFGPAGFTGSIAWAQYRPHDGEALRYRVRRAAMSVAVGRLISIAARAKQRFGDEKQILLRGRAQWPYQFWRIFLPHGPVEVARFARRIGAESSQVRVQPGAS